MSIDLQSSKILDWMQVEHQAHQNQEAQSEFTNIPYWSQEETRKFVEAVAIHDGNWEKISQVIGTKSIDEVYHKLPPTSTRQNRSDMIEYYLNEERKKRPQEMTFPSFFMQKIAPMLKNGYDGFFSLVEELKVPGSTRPSAPQQHHDV